MEVLNEESTLVNEGPSMNESHSDFQAPAMGLVMEEEKCYVCGDLIVKAVH